MHEGQSRQHLVPDQLPTRRLQRVIMTLRVRLVDFAALAFATFPRWLANPMKKGGLFHGGGWITSLLRGWD